MMSTTLRWEQMLSNSADKGIFKLAQDTKTREQAWLLWRKTVHGHAQKLGLDAYRKAVHWVYLSRETKKLFGGKTSLEPSLCAPKFCVPKDDKHQEYHILGSLLASTLEPARIQTESSEQWASRFAGMIDFVTGTTFPPSFPPFPVEEQPLFHQLLAAELPWLLGCLFPDLLVTPKLLAMARENFRVGLSEILDGAGLPHASDYRLLCPLLACWTRAMMIGKQAKISPWAKEDQTQYEWVIQQTLRFLRKDGSFVFDSEGRDEKSFVAMMKTALAFDKDAVDRTIAGIVFPKLLLKEERESKTMKTMESLSPAAYFSDWGQMAMLRTDWSVKSPSLSIAFAKIREFDDPENDDLENNDLKNKEWTDQSVRMELNVDGKTFWSGLWNVAVRMDEKLLLPIDKWSVSCDVSDEDADYLELELLLTENMRLQRHFLLAHKEKLLLLADTILRDDRPQDGTSDTDQGHWIDYTLQFPFAENLKIKPHAESTELLLCEKNVPLVRVFPLSFPEWKNAPESPGKCSPEQNSLQLHQHGTGTGMFVPLMFDLSPKRLSLPFTWRQLTVGENLQIVKNDRAAAFRLQTGKTQTLLYRSLTATANRTFFGHNLVSDFFFGRFDPKKGDVEVIMAAEEEFS